jgi:hypothetical protein
MMWIDLLGWAAAALTFLTFSMRTMLPLRIVAIGANVLFISYGALAGIYPVLALHLLLLPFNLFRLVEILRMTTRVRQARMGEFDPGWIAQLLPARPNPAGTTLFRKGDPPDYLYYVVSGRVHLVEAGLHVGAGELLGEIAFFSDAKERTLTAVCAEACEIVQIDERAFMQLYSQNPAFGMYVVRLVARRLLDGMAKAPSAYLPKGGS